MIIVYFEGRKEIATNVLKMGAATVEQIAEATGLSVEEIRTLSLSEPQQDQ